MNELSIVPDQQMTIDGLEDQVKSIKILMQKVMVEGTHYGKIPGCGDKDALLQPGAHKLGLLFGFAPEYIIDINDLKNEHREYEIICKLTHRSSGIFIGQGVGICTTKESKYRFRSEDTGLEVPPEYWDSRDRNLLGGATFSPKKINKKWHIVQKVDHDNPSDYYNTAKKIAKKRAYNDAILTATAASDMFIPDDETPSEFINGSEPKKGQDQAPVKQPTRVSQSSGVQIASVAQRNLIYAKLKSADIKMDVFEKEYGQLDVMPFDNVNKCLNWIRVHK